MKPVFSSHVEQIGYEDGNLIVVYKAKKNQPARTAIYEGVPPDIGEQVVNAPSVGTALHQFVKGIYGHRYLD